jgi:Ni/Fe-hydrogenase subunit HybB-like protein
MELTVSVGLIALGFGAFALAVRHLPVFPAQHRVPAAVEEEPPLAAAVPG